jgi:hypothetical protein
MSAEVAAATVIGGMLNYGSSSSASKRAIKLQKEMAKNGIQWRVADAKKAGLHPLAALGMSPNQATPTLVGDRPGDAISEGAKVYQDGKLQDLVMDGQKWDNERKMWEAQEARNRARIKNMEMNEKLNAHSQGLYGSPLMADYYADGVQYRLVAPNTVDAYENNAGWALHGKHGKGLLDITNFTK